MNSAKSNKTATKKKISASKVAISASPNIFTKFSKNHPRLFKVAVFAVPFVIYLICSLIYLHPPSLVALHDDVFNSSPDPQQFVWFMNWWPFAITHHLNPFVTHYAWYPNGYNLTWATSIPALAIIMAPVTWIGGATLSFNLLALLGPPLAALTCFWLLHSITKRFVPSLLGGYIYGFSTYQMGQLVGHPHMYFDFLIPVLILLGWQYYNRKIRTIPFITLIAILLAVQFGISTELFATFIIFSTIAAIVFYVFYRQREVRERLRTVMLHFYGAVAISLALVSPYLYFMLSGYNKVPGELHSLTTFSSDALNFIVPTAVTQLGGRHFLHISLHFLGNFSEDGAYVGLPLVILLIYIAIKYWRKTLMLALTVLLALIVLFSLGPILHVAGHTGHIGHIMGIPLPWIIPAHLPLIKSALPDRFTMYMSLVIAIIVGLWLSFKTNSRTRNYKYGAVLIGIVFIVPTASQYSWSKVAVPAVFDKSHVNSYIPKNSNVIILPYGRLGSDMYDQYTSGMWFTQSGGYVGAAPTDYTDSTVIMSFLDDTPQPNFTRDLVKFCHANKVSKIIYTSDTAPALTDAINSLGWPTRTYQEATIVSVPGS